MSAWAKPTVEGKLRSFLGFAIDKLEAAAPSFEDEEEEEGENYSELCNFAVGLSRALKNTGASASPEIKGGIAAALEPVWDIKTDQPGEALKDGMVAALKATLESLVAEGGVLYTAPEPEPEPAEPEEEPSEEALAAREARLLRAAQNPSGIRDMSFETALNHMWGVLDKDQHMSWGEDGFAFELGRKGKFGRDVCDDPLFVHCNMENRFWEKETTKTFIALLDNYEREVGARESVTRDEKKEMDAFLDALTSSGVMRFAFNWLRHHGTDPRCKGRRFKDMNDFNAVLFDIWFAPYRRKAANDS